MPGLKMYQNRVIEAVAMYPNRDDLFRNYPELDQEDLGQALAFANTRGFTRKEFPLRRSCRVLRNSPPPPRGPRNGAKQAIAVSQNDDGHLPPL